MEEEDAMQFEYDPKRLIDEVKKRPGIWDLEDPNYRAKHVRQQLWKEIVRELMPEDIKVSKSEMRELEMQLQKKWKGIRDCFQKYVTKPNRTRRPYIYTKQLQFLWKTKSNEETDNNESDEDCPQVTVKKLWKSKRTLKLNSQEQQSSEEDNDNEDNVESHEMFAEDSNDAESVEIPAKIPRTSKPNVNEFAFANVDAVPVKSDDDTDRLFLLSLLPHMKSIPEEFRLNVKMDMLQVLKNANYMSTRSNKLL